VAALAALGSGLTGPPLAARLSEQAQAAIAGPVARRSRPTFPPPAGRAATRSSMGGEKLDEATRAKVADALAAIRGIGGIRWADDARQ